jgi:hypothetical protein
MSNLELIRERSIKVRRKLQYQVLKQWDQGKITGLDCINKIVDFEKLIYLNKDIITGSVNPEEKESK